MKKQFILLTLLLSAASAFAVEEEIDGLWYELVSKTKEAKVIQNKGNDNYRGSIVIPETVEYNGDTYSVTSIGDEAFLDCNVGSVRIGDSVTTIGDKAFYGCSSLTSVAIGTSVTSIGEYAFRYTKLASVTIPNSVTIIGSDAFERCSYLTSVTIGNSVTTIGNEAFDYCSKLTSVHISDIEAWCNISFGGDHANPLYYAHHLYLNGEEVKDLVIPDNVTSINSYAFNYCSGLNTITIGSGVKDIKGNAFSNCSDLTDVYCYAENVPNTNTNAFQDSYIDYVTLHVPAPSIDAYKAKSPWKDFKTIEALSGTQKCATPTISYVEGKLVFDCETEQVTFFSEIQNGDVKKDSQPELTLTPTYVITVYASREDYVDSDVATATIRWRNGRPVFEGFSSVTLEAGDILGDVNRDGDVGIGDIVTITNIIAGTDTSYLNCPDDHHPHWIDMGLPSGTQWRCCNEGASTPEAFGGYYQFGQVSTAPTLEQIQELLNYCSYTWTTQNGVNGGKFTGPNGGTIFLPAAGSVLGGEFILVGSYGDYWSSTPNDEPIAYELSFGSSTARRYGSDRGCEQSVRPVR